MGVLILNIDMDAFKKQKGKNYNTSPILACLVFVVWLAHQLWKQGSQSINQNLNRHRRK
ncbi:hypothetical protein [Moraxella lacunata]|uniref:hypothetical protein n=1 Tax=Moraxella lacunata TaxID=477 RepID=UPI003EE22C43